MKEDPVDEALAVLTTQYDPIDEEVQAVQMGKPPKETPWIPSELREYLETLLHPPGGGDLLIVDLVHNPLPDGPPDHYHGAIIRGTPTPEESEWVLGMLRPGAHLFLVAPDEQPTGHTGACNIEDAGFEIRDAIAWVREGGHIHYCPKVKSKKERHSGTGGLPKEKVETKGVYRLRSDLTVEKREQVKRELLVHGVDPSLVESL